MNAGPGTQDPGAMMGMPPDMDATGPAAPSGDPGQSPSPAAAMNAQQDCVPLDALNVPDEQEQMQAPEVGDKVQYTSEGTIAKIDGPNAYVKRESINGQPVDNDEAQGQSEKEPDADDEGQGAGYGDLKDIANHTQLQ